MGAAGLASLATEFWNELEDADTVIQIANLASELESICSSKKEADDIVNRSKAKANSRANSKWASQFWTMLRQWIQYVTICDFVSAI